MPDPEVITNPEAKPPLAPDSTAAELAALRAEIAALKAPKVPVEDDLSEKARKAREASDSDAGKTKRLESALVFTMKAPEFLKQNEGLLPKDVKDLFAQADKETYSDATEKAAAMKSALIQSFFQVQANVDLMTPGQKASLDEYLKLTKTGKQDRAQSIYDMVLEPVLETARRMKKADALRNGYSDSGADAAYKEKLIRHSEATYGIPRRNK